MVLSLTTGGERIEGRGYFYAPTVLRDVQPGSRLLREEIFGPVLGVTTFETDAEAVAAANDTEYGLVSYAYTRDLARAHRLIDELETGMMGLNTGLVSNAAAPFGGVKASGPGSRRRAGGDRGVPGDQVHADPGHVIGPESTVELRTFRYFVAVADAGSVNAAAHALHLTQPSLARQLRRLERRLSLPLLELQGGRTVLTVTGHRFLPYARELLATANATMVAASSLADGLADDLVPDLTPEDETSRLTSVVSSRARLA